MDVRTTTVEAPQFANGVTGGDGGDHAQLHELRQTLAALSEEVTLFTRRNVAAAVNSANEAAAPIRVQIRQAPLASLAVAAVGGVLLALAVTALTARRETNYGRATRYLSEHTGFDVPGYADRLRGAATWARDAGTGLLPHVERLATQLSRMDSGETIKSAVDHASTWMSTLLASPKK